MTPGLNSGTLLAHPAEQQRNLNAQALAGLRSAGLASALRVHDPRSPNLRGSLGSQEGHCNSRIPALRLRPESAMTRIQPLPNHRNHGRKFTFKVAVTCHASCSQVGHVRASVVVGRAVVSVIASVELSACARCELQSRPLDLVSSRRLLRPDQMLSCALIHSVDTADLRQTPTLFSQSQSS